jgi:hypothetical protein
LLRLKKKLPPMPEESRFDRMSETNLFIITETSIGEAGNFLTQYRDDRLSREQNLAWLEVELETALGAARALRRKVVL